MILHEVAPPEAGKMYIAVNFFKKTVVAQIDIWGGSRLMCVVDGRSYDLNETMGNGTRFYGPVQLQPA